MCGYLGRAVIGIDQPVYVAPERQTELDVGESTAPWISAAPTTQESPLSPRFSLRFSLR